MTPDRLRAITGAYPRLRIGVVGDFCLDRYLEIDPDQAEVSIETGLEVHNVVRVRAQPGAAGTVLNNLAALGVGELIPVGWCGDDGEGYELRRGLAALRGVKLDHFATHPDRRTFTYCKPLIVHPPESPRELNRLDSKNWDSTPVEVQTRTVRSLEMLADSVDALILLDQVDREGTGVITPLVLECVGKLVARLPGLRIVGDSRRGLRDWPAVTLKMNAVELANLLGERGPFSVEDVRRSAAHLAERTGQDVIITMAERGLVGAQPNGRVDHQPALPTRGEIDIVGAGDSVTANVTAGLAAGCDLSEALVLASLASSVVIHKLGTTGTATPEEIGALLNDMG